MRWGWGVPVCCQGPSCRHHRPYRVAAPSGRAVGLFGCGCHYILRCRYVGTHSGEAEGEIHRSKTCTGIGASISTMLIMRAIVLLAVAHLPAPAVGKVLHPRILDIALQGAGEHSSVWRAAVLEGTAQLNLQREQMPLPTAVSVALPLPGTVLPPVSPLPCAPTRPSLYSPPDHLAASPAAGPLTSCVKLTLDRR